MDPKDEPNSARRSRRRTKRPNRFSPTEKLDRPRRRQEGKPLLKATSRPVSSATLPFRRLPPVVDESSAAAASNPTAASLTTFAPTTVEHTPAQPLFQDPNTVVVVDPVTSDSEPAFVEQPPVAPQHLDVIPAAVTSVDRADLSAVVVAYDSLTATMEPLATPTPTSDLAESDSFATPTLQAAHLGAVPNQSVTSDSSIQQPTSLQVESSVVEVVTPATVTGPISSAAAHQAAPSPPPPSSALESATEADATQGVVVPLLSGRSSAGTEGVVAPLLSGRSSATPDGVVAPLLSGRSSAGSVSWLSRTESITSKNDLELASSRSTSSYESLESAATMKSQQTQRIERSQAAAMGTRWP